MPSVVVKGHLTLGFTVDSSALENLKSHLRKLGFTLDDKVYY